ncbi:hypothetical protein BV25DRAFT_1837347 [Artomyces pyxidatus]|uniref:Uncharacterized protein n=1 Tax=Artomyces pyxidatus TaxID=48021 RepID=A0ACB8T6L3_9AGAM|nr:hypothetical protein BV25DRAFT_1837347 [Artomyces pyxidatus]
MVVLTRTSQTRKATTSSKRAKYTDRYKHVCAKDAHLRRPGDHVCVKCGRPIRCTKITYCEPNAGSWNSVCIECNYGFYAPQQGPTPEQKALIDAVRLADALDAEEAATKRRLHASRMRAERRVEATQRRQAGATLRQRSALQRANGDAVRSSDVATGVASNVTLRSLSGGGRAQAHAGAGSHYSLQTPSCSPPAYREKEDGDTPAAVSNSSGRRPLTNIDVINYPPAGDKPFASDPVESDSEPEEPGRRAPMTDRCPLALVRVVFWTSRNRDPIDILIATRTPAISLAASPEFMAASGLAPNRSWERWDFQACQWAMPKDLTHAFAWHRGIPVFGRLSFGGWGMMGNGRGEDCRFFSRYLYEARKSIGRAGLPAGNGGDGGDGAGNDGDDGAGNDGDDGAGNDGDDGAGNDGDDDRGGDENIPPARGPTRSTPSTPRSRVIERLDREFSFDASPPRPYIGKPRPTRKLARKPAPYPGPTRAPAQPVAGPSRPRQRRPSPPPEEWDWDRGRWYIDVDAQEEESEDAEDGGQGKGKGKAKAKAEGMSPEWPIDLTKKK